MTEECHKVSEVDKLKRPGCEGTTVLLTQRAGPRLKALTLPVLSTVLLLKEKVCPLYSAGLQVPFDLTMLTTLQSFLCEGGCAIIPISLQLREPVILVFQLFNCSSDLDIESHWNSWASQPGNIFGVHPLTAEWPASWIYYRNLETRPEEVGHST